MQTTWKTAAPSIRVTPATHARIVARGREDRCPGGFSGVAGRFIHAYASGQILELPSNPEMGARRRSYSIRVLPRVWARVAMRARDEGWSGTSAPIAALVIAYGRGDIPLPDVSEPYE